GFRRRGADGAAFPSIVASGANATVLHYVANDRIMRDGELVLLDAGARNDAYCADISRTFPVGGRFSADQRVLYDAVRAARDAGVAAALPGATVDDVHAAALRVLVTALVEIGCVDGPVESLLEPDRASEVRAFYPHRTSHWLGLDVHDVGDYRIDERSRRLEPGMVLTVEPGLYIPASAARAPAELAGTGVRVEDDVLITPEGNEVLTAALPVDAAAIEALME
ncbi:MAG: M24 family metallopeptidase, partial [Longimicrobiales bacterium]